MSDLQRHFRMSQPALSRHLQVLRAANLVRTRRDGRANLYRLHAEPMEPVMDWMLHYREFWLGSFEKLRELLRDEGE